MIRKIGEIFDYNGEWYQCVKGGRCKNCDLEGLDECYSNECRSDKRKDDEEVIYKKLEKVGEPYELYGHLIQKYRYFHSPAIQVNGNCISKTINTDNIIKIKIKQNKEDMEENKTTLPKEDNVLTRTVYAYVNGKISDKELIKSIKEMSDEYPYNKNNLKPFSLELAKSGKPVCTRDGRKARIISFNRDFLFKGRNYCIVALINDGPHNETVYSYTEDGLYNQNEIHDNDLMMLSEKRSGWLVIRKDTELYNSKEAAICMNDSYIPVKVEFEI